MNPIFRLVGATLRAIAVRDGGAPALKSAGALFCFLVIGAIIGAVSKQININMI
ncbi:MAG: hypothetical protein HPY71_07780 [Firmicutes bacterium]|nr:hypothetical protein [Bacillota bacterium]